MMCHLWNFRVLGCEEHRSTNAPLTLEKPLKTQIGNKQFLGIKIRISNGS